MKKYIKYLYIIIPVAILIAGFFYFFSNKTEKNILVDESARKVAETNIVQTDTETTSPTNEYISSDVYIFGLNIPPSSPAIGFPTGLKQYPRLTWEEKNIESNSNAKSENIEVHYPQFIGGSIVKKLNEYIYSLIESTISKDQKMVVPGADSIENSVQLSAKYNVVGVDNGIVSVEVVMTDFTGGGNGNHNVSYPINWDLKSDRLLIPDDIFCSKNWISTLMPMARKMLLQYYDQNLGIPNLPDDLIEWINRGTSSDPSNWKNLLLSKRGLIVVFEPYQVSSGSSGIIRIYIPDSVSPPFLCLP